MNATLPSSVFDVVADQRCLPNFLPTMDACEKLFRWLVGELHETLTNASPTPSANIPVNWSSREGLKTSGLINRKVYEGIFLPFKPHRASTASEEIEMT